MIAFGIRAPVRYPAIVEVAQYILSAMLNIGDISDKHYIIQSVGKRIFDIAAVLVSVFTYVWIYLFVYIDYFTHDE